MARNYKKLKIFHLSYALLLELYDVLPALPDIELRTMFAQLQGAGVGLVLHIVEGASNKSNKIFFNHLEQSHGCVQEIDMLLMLAYDLSYIDKELYVALSVRLEELQGSLHRFMRGLEKEIAHQNSTYAIS